MRYFIIEHPTRGILLEASEVGEPRFSPTALRSSDRAMRGFSLAEAHHQRDRYTNERTREQCQIRVSPSGDEYDWKVVA